MQAIAPISSEYITARQAEELFGVSRHSVKSYANKYKTKVRKQTFEGLVFYHRDDVKAYVDSVHAPRVEESAASLGRIWIEVCRERHKTPNPVDPEDDGTRLFIYCARVHEHTPNLIAAFLRGMSGSTSALHILPSEVHRIALHFKRSVAPKSEIPSRILRACKESR